MSSIQLNSVNLNYIVEGEGPDMILLHGWGQNIEMMKPISDYLKKNFKVYTIDFPGFGDGAAVGKCLPKAVSNVFTEYVSVLLLRL